MPPDQPLLIFDGICHLCSRSVRFILKHDARGSLRFAPLQSRIGTRLMLEHGLDPADAETFLLIKGGRPFVRSDAAVEVARELRFPWSLLALVGVLPRRIRDAGYLFVARNRYGWFGKRDTCYAPLPEERSRFIDEAR